MKKYRRLRLLKLYDRMKLSNRNFSEEKNERRSHISKVKTF